MNLWPWLGIGGLLLFWNKLFGASMVQITDITNQLPKGSGAAYSSRQLSDIKIIVIHHSATTSGDPWAYAKYQVEQKGWPGIGYHFVIQPDGKVYQTNQLTTISYQATGVNAQSIGICMTGNFDTTTPPPAQYGALISLLRHLRDLIGQVPIKGHREIKSTSCPGNMVNIAAIEVEAWGSENLA